MESKTVQDKEKCKIYFPYHSGDAIVTSITIGDFTYVKIKVDNIQTRIRKENIHLRLSKHYNNLDLYDDCSPDEIINMISIDCKDKLFEHGTLVQGIYVWDNDCILMVNNKGQIRIWIDLDCVINENTVFNMFTFSFKSLDLLNTSKSFERINKSFERINTSVESINTFNYIMICILVLLFLFVFTTCVMKR